MILVEVFFFSVCYGVIVIIVFIYIDKVVVFFVFVSGEWYIVDIVLRGVIYYFNIVIVDCLFDCCDMFREVVNLVIIVDWIICFDGV